MMELDDGLAWAALARTPALPAACLRTVLERLGGPREILAASVSLRMRAGLPEAGARFLSSREALPRGAELAWLQAPRHHVLPFTAAQFPRLLQSLADPPVALYVSGDLAALNDPQLAIVGSRNPSAQGRDNAAEFARQLGARGLAITSGAAEGIDAAAHSGALDAGARTLAVLGTGVDIVYPRSNSSLQAQIDRHGALVSEFALGTPPRRANFPRRNRLIAAMSLGTLVVEAARRSGSLITARLANDYGREVFAIPGSIHNPLSRGCHALIKTGACLVETADDILGELNFSAFFANDLDAPERADAKCRSTAGMDKDRKILLDALGFDPVDLDTLVVRTGFKPEAVSSMMLILELEGHVQAAPGGRYSRVAYRSRR